MPIDGYGWKNDPDISSFLPEEFSVDSTAFWREVTAPTLLCWGNESFTADPREDDSAAHLPDHRTVVFEKAGHWQRHDQLDGFLAMLKEFL
jgi:pimeloyl-ACP methyl ester carboxylesterase